MYKIIFLSMSSDSPMYEHNLSLVDESFETKEEAKKFIDGLIEVDAADTTECCGGDDELIADYEFDKSDFEDEVDVDAFYCGDLIYRNEYRIVEVK